nr:structural protein [Tolivirales sp.]
MAKKTRGTRRKVVKVAEESTSYATYAKRLAALIATGFIGAAANRYINKKTYSDLQDPSKARSFISVDLDIDSPMSYVPYRTNGGLTGRGAYTWRQAGRDVSTGIGTVAGGVLGARTGSKYGIGIGSSVGGGIGTEVGNMIFGRGAYNVSQNSLYSHGTVLSEGMDTPKFIEGGQFTRISHCEFVQDIVVPATPTAFTNMQFTINPGNPALFPWLASIANNYQQYELMGMVVHFKSTSTDFSTSGALGSVILATNYDVLEVPFANKIIMENSQYAVSAKPSLSQLHAVECDPKLTVSDVKYIRNASSSTTVSQDARFYDHGSFQIATVGLSATAGQVLGELWVTYDIKLLKPEIVNTSSLLVGQRIASVANNNVTKNNVWGDSPSVTGSIFVTTAGNTMVFQRAGQYLIDWNLGGSAILAPAQTGTTTAVLKNFIMDSPPRTHLTYLVTCTIVGQTVVFDFTSSGGVGTSEMRIASYFAANG